MASENSKIDGNNRHTLLGVTNDANAFLKNLLVDPTTGALLCSFLGTVSNFADGTVGAPSITFTSDTATGFYHTGAGATSNILASINGVNKLTLTPAVFSSANPLMLPVGAVGTPSLFFGSDTTSGFYHTGTGATGSILAAINGVKVSEITASLLKTTGISVVVGAAALLTTATDGFLYIPTCAGTPTGVPTTQTGTVAMVHDTTNHKLYVYDGSWIAMN